jgi:transcriptional regulator
MAFPNGQKVRPQEIVTILKICDKNVSHIEKSQRVVLKHPEIRLRILITSPKLSAS